MKRLALSVFAFLLLIPFSAVGVAEMERDPIIYFVMVDRFSNGDPSNDRGGEGASRDESGYDPRDPGFFHGGDLRGLREQLDHITSLGFTAIWITPVVRQVPVSPTGESAAYHGYWGAGFDEIDPRFGTMSEMKEFVTAAHSKGLKVFLDVVVNHTGDLISYKEGDAYLSLKEHPYRRIDGTIFNPTRIANSPKFPSLASLDVVRSFPKTLLLNDSVRKSPEWLNDPRNYHNRGNFSSSGESATFGDFYGLDDLFTESPQVLDGWVDIFGDWIREVGVDGFRLDTYKHVNQEFWSEFLPRIVRIAKESGKEYFPMWGEIYDYDPGRITEWIKQTGLREVLDFPTQGAIAGYVIDENAKEFALTFDNDDLYITADSDASRNGTFLGNHDMGRVGGFIYNRYRDGEIALKKLEIAHAMLYALRGIPIVYYGDEFGMIGGRDKAARQSLFPTQVGEWQREPRIGMEPIGSGSYFEREHPLHQLLRELSDIREQYPGLRDGYQEVKAEENGLITLRRVDESSASELIFLFNATARTTRTSIAGVADFNIIRGDISLIEERVNVPPHSWSLLRRDLGEVNPLEERPRVTLLKPSRYKYDSSLFFLRARVDGVRYPKVRFEYRAVGEDWKSLGVDTSPIYGRPLYRIAPPRSALPPDEKLRVRAVATGVDGSEVRSKALLLRLPK